MLALNLVYLTLPLSTFAAVLPHGLHQRSLVERLEDRNVYIGYDTRDNIIQLYDRDEGYVGELSVDDAMPHLSRRGIFDVPTGCFEMDGAQIDSLNGKAKIEEKAQQCFGGQGKRRFTNPTDKDDLGDLKKVKAWRCFNELDMIKDVKLSGDPKCQKSIANKKGTVIGTDGATIQFTNRFGTTASSTNSVSNSASVALGASFKTEFGLPSIASTEQTFSMNLEYNHQNNKATTEEINDTQEETLSFINPGGKTCVSKLETSKCTSDADAKIESIADGWIWFEFDGGVTLAAECHGPNQPPPAADDKRFKWAMPLKAFSEDERKMLTPMKSQVKVSTLGTNYWVECTDANGKVTTTNATDKPGGRVTDSGASASAPAQTKPPASTESTAEEDTPTDGVTANDTPAGDAPVGDAPTNDAPTDDAPVDDAPVDDTPTDDAPVEDAPADDAPADDAPADAPPVDDLPGDDLVGAPPADTTVPVDDATAV